MFESYLGICLKLKKQKIPEIIKIIVTNFLYFFWLGTLYIILKVSSHLLRTDACNLNSIINTNKLVILAKEHIPTPSRFRTTVIFPAAGSVELRPPPALPPSTDGKLVLSGVICN